MTRPKKNQKKQPPKKRRSGSSGNSRTKNKSLPKSDLKNKAVKLIGPILLSLLLAFVARQYRGTILNNVHKYNCVEYSAGDFGAQIVYNAINLQHQIRENPNKKDELLNLLNEEVIWFRKSKRRVSKDKIRTYSKYDNFCFAKYPIYDVKDDFRRNYEMRFIGYHRFRNVDSLFVTVEKYYCKLDDGKISEIYPVPMNSLEKESYENTNFWYKRISIIVFIVSLTIILLIRFIISLPEGIISWLKELFSKYLPF